jgi:D-glycero-alpha-D-manno-heptose-7-phosphate kinase
MIVRSRAPLRVSLAGGGTDLSEYSDEHVGAVLNATIDQYAWATLCPRSSGDIVFRALDTGTCEAHPAEASIGFDGRLDLAKAVYNRIVKEFNEGRPLSFELRTAVDAPPGSGLGSSSTLVVAVVGAFVEWLRLPLGEYDIARLAYEIERIDLGQEGGRQDQYAATFGGWNFMEFHPDDKVIVNPLRIREPYLYELEASLILYYTGVSRVSSSIISSQISNIRQGRQRSLSGLHELKKQAVMMKEALLTGELNRMGELLDIGWRSKKQTASSISNDWIDEIYLAAKAAGATGGKITGAGGGGYLMFYCPGTSRHEVAEVLSGFGGTVHRVRFVHQGVTAWEGR